MENLEKRLETIDWHGIRIMYLGIEQEYIYVIRLKTKQQIVLYLWIAVSNILFYSNKEKHGKHNNKTTHTHTHTNQPPIYQFK